MDNISIKRMDHHGLVMGVIRDLDMIDLINERLSTYKDDKISVGERIAAMIVNGLGFTDQPLSLVPEFFEELPLAELFGKPYEAKDFNRFSLSRALDRVYEYGEEALFAELAAEACKRSGVDVSRQSFDTTSFALSGEYANEVEETCIKITQGYSKDHRPDLKQIVTELLVSHDSGVPLVLKNWNGNASDTKIFEQRTKQLTESFNRGYCKHVTADSKFYTEANSSHWHIVKFTTRVPETLNPAKELIMEVTKKDEWEAHDSGKLWYAVSDIHHYGTDQRWLVCRSKESKTRAKKSVEKAVIKERESIEKDLYHLQAKRFNCAVDAEKAALDLPKKWKYHQAVKVSCTEHHKYNSRGRPANVEPTRTEYQVQLSYQEDAAKIEKSLIKKSCFILATNQTKENLSNNEVIDSYKEQQSVERGYRFLKEPQFFTSSFFLKKPERISALIMVMTLSLLVYTIAQRRLRSAMDDKKETLPDQNKKPSARITLKRAFQLLRGIHVVNLMIEGAWRYMIQGMNEVKIKIIELIGGSALNIYQLYYPKGHA